MKNRVSLAREGLTEALKLRSSSELGIRGPICVYDLAEKLGLEVRFVEVPSLEGMYCKFSPPLILISSLRPPGRRTFTCAHELGHHIFGHGTRADMYLDDPAKANASSPEEFQADCFAGFLLMPKLAVSRAFAARGIEPEKASPEVIYGIANWFGVGYTAIIRHLRESLRMLSFQRSSELEKVSIKDIRGRILGNDGTSNVLLIDFHWTERSIDAEVGDLLVIPSSCVAEGDCIEKIGTVTGTTLVIRATQPGLARLSDNNSSWSCHVRVARRQYVGRAIFRHLEDKDGD